MVTIRETRESDLSLVQALWADGDVMRFVGFPDGLHQSDAQMSGWYRRIESGRPSINHYSIFLDDRYCGESFYRIDPERGHRAALDIKLFPFARGQGIAAGGLSHAIAAAFRHGADVVWVDPDPNNAKAIALYRRLGFVQKAVPDDLRDETCEQLYFELTREAYGQESGLA